MHIPVERRYTALAYYHPSLIDEPQEMLISSSFLSGRRIHEPKWHPCLVLRVPVCNAVLCLSVGCTGNGKSASAESDDERNAMLWEQ